MESRVHIAGYSGRFNENGEFMPEGSGIMQTEISNPEFDRMMMEADTFEQAYNQIIETGASCYIGVNKNIIIYPVEKGTIIFLQNGTSQNKIVMDQELSPEIALKLQEAKTNEDIENILIANNIVKDPNAEIEREGVNKIGEHMVDKADNVHDGELGRDGAISQNRENMYRREVGSMDR